MHWSTFLLIKRWFEKTMLNRYMHIYNFINNIVYGNLQKLGLFHCIAELLLKRYETETMFSFFGVLGGWLHPQHLLPNISCLFHHFSFFFFLVNERLSPGLLFFFFFIANLLTDYANVYSYAKVTSRWPLI